MPKNSTPWSTSATSTSGFNEAAVNRGGKRAWQRSASCSSGRFNEAAAIRRGKRTSQERPPPGTPRLQ